MLLTYLISAWSSGLAVLAADRTIVCRCRVVSGDLRAMRPITSRSRGFVPTITALRPSAVLPGVDARRAAVVCRLETVALDGSSSHRPSLAAPHHVAGARAEAEPPVSPSRRWRACGHRRRRGRGVRPRQPRIRAGRARRSELAGGAHREALAQLYAYPADPDDSRRPRRSPAHLPEATESVQPEPFHISAARISQSQARIEAEIAAERPSGRPWCDIGADRRREMTGRVPPR